MSGSEFPLEETDQFVGESAGPADRELAARNVKFILGLADNSTDSKDEMTDALDKENATESTEQTPHKQKIKNFAAQAVRFVEPVVHSAYDQSDRLLRLSKQSSIDVTSKLDSETHTSSQLPDYTVSDRGAEAATPDDLPPEPPVITVGVPSSVIFTSQPSRKGRSSLTGQSLSLNTNLASSFTPCSMPQSSACFTTPNPESIPPAAVRDLTSMFSPLIGEYTSITDNIDTSCLIDCSPPCSPASTSGIMFSVSESYHDVDAKLKERSAADSKQMELKQAEEMEHQRMESLIRHRLRQISQVSSISFCSSASHYYLCFFIARDRKFTD